MARAFALPAANGFSGYFGFSRGAAAIPALDGLRAAAILLVLCRHAITPFREPGSAFLPAFGWDAATPLVNGWIGVDLFFVLSGFLIARGLIRRFDETGHVSLRRYFTRRALRILPAYYAMLGIAAAGLIPYFAVAPDMLGLRVAYHAVFLQDYLPANIVVAFWSLGVEEKFYIVAPFVLVPLLRLRNRGVQYAAIAVLILTPLCFRLNILASGTPIPDYQTFFTTLRSPFHRGFDGLAVGILVALLVRDRGRPGWVSDPRAATAVFWAGAAAIGWLWLKAPLLDAIDGFDRTFLQLVLALGFGAVVLGALGGGGPARLMGARFLLPVSILSYSLYLVHMTVIPGAMMAAESLANGLPGGETLPFGFFLTLYVLFSVSGALLLHFGVEKPFMQARSSVPGARRADPVPQKG